VGDQQLVLEYRGRNHEPGNGFIHLPRLRILMLVDVIVPGWVPFTPLGVATDGSAGSAGSAPSPRATAPPC
jgi:hypothetical protein